MNTTTIATAKLAENEYNPNRMTGQEFAELVDEVRHLGRLPKPIVVRQDGAGFVIVDGEHGWRAAQEVGLAEVACEVIEADDFEARRQTYKRNQHGTHDPVQLGRMFRQMTVLRHLSQRRLAKDIGASEGTIRNMILYAEAADLRSRYARSQGNAVEVDDSEISRLSVRQVRHYVHLPRSIADLWLDAGADLRALYEGAYGTTKTDATVEASERGMPQAVDAHYEALDDSDLINLLPALRSPRGFVKAMRTLTAWTRWEKGYCQRGLTVADLRPYTRHCFAEAWPVRTTSLMGSALDALIDPNTTPPTLPLTPDEFAQVVTESESHDESAGDFWPRLRVLIHEKTGRLPEDAESVKRRLLELEIQDYAPSYIRDSVLAPEEKYALWHASGWPESTNEEAVDVTLDDAKRALTQRGRIPLNKGEAVEDAIMRHLDAYRDEERLRQRWAVTTEADLAARVAERLGLYDEERQGEALATLVAKLAELTKQELMCLYEGAELHRNMQARLTVIRRLGDARF